MYNLCMNKPVAGPLTDNEYWESQYSSAASQLGRTRPGDNVAFGLDRILDLIQRQAPFAIGDRYLEIGCGGSTMIPRIHQRFGFAIVGIDYTETGCESARQIAAAHSIPAEIVKADLFSPPNEMFGSFDVVGSYGVVEHFADTASVLRSCASFLKPGGLLVTSIPCMRSLSGVLLRYTNRSLYNKHLPLNAPLLADAHREADLEVIESRSILGLPLILSLNRQGIVRRSLGALSDVILGMESRGFGVPGNRWTSPYAVCIARKT